MQETVKKLNIKGLYVVSMKLSSNRWGKLMSERHNCQIGNYSSKPVNKITDLIKLFEESLSHLDWDVDEFTEEHGDAIQNMNRKLKEDRLGRWVIKK